MLPISQNKPVTTRVNVWLSLRSRFELALFFVGVFVLILLSDLVLDAVKGQKLDRNTLEKTMMGMENLKPFAEGDAVEKWLDRCVAVAPRLKRPVVVAPDGRIPLLERYLACLAISDLFSDKAILLDIGTGAGGTGFALWSGVVAHGPNRQVVIEHTSNRLTAGNVPGLQAKLKYFEDPLFTLQHMCQKGLVELVCVNFLEESVSESIANSIIETLQKCSSSLQVVAIIGLDETKVQPLVDSETEYGWSVLVSKTELVSSSSMIKCTSYYQVGCKSIAWTLLYRQGPSKPSTPSKATD